MVAKASSNLTDRLNKVAPHWRGGHIFHTRTHTCLKKNKNFGQKSQQDLKLRKIVLARANSNLTNQLTKVVVGERSLWTVRE
jgi:hypothetical protein